MRQDRRRAVAWTLTWFGAWIAFAALYAVLMYAQSLGSMSLGLSLVVAAITTVVPAALAPAVWWVSGRCPFQERRRWTFLARHGGLALLFAGTWSAWTFVIERASAGPQMSMASLVHRVLPVQILTGVLLYGAIVAASYATRVVLHARELELLTEQAQRMRAQAELAALRAHIDPHFLFNTLHSISELVTSDASTARRALEHLSEVFRYTLQLDRNGVDLVPLEQEWTLVQNYLSLEQMRLGSRLTVDASIDDDVMICAIPPFTMQPIVENAIRHGLSAKSSGGTLRIRAREIEGTLMIEVDDDGNGPPSDLGTARGLGLRSARQRLAAHFGPDGQLDVRMSARGGTVVTMKLPSRLVEESSLASRWPPNL